MGAAVANTELPERLRVPSRLLAAATAPVRRPLKWVGRVAGLVLLLASVGVTAAQAGLLRFWWGVGEMSLEARVQQVERQAPEIEAIALAYPIEHAPVAIPYGTTSQPPGTSQTLHTGIDLYAAKGTAFVAAAAGTVAATGADPDLGLVVVVTHGKIDGVPVSTWYGHVDRFLVKAGEAVSAGQPLATIGTSGLATAPVVHFEVRVGGKPEDPMRWLP